jgi:PFU (PLAA family ubiquitin binding).
MGINFNAINQFVKIANGIKNPKQGIKVALDAMEKKNPQMAKELRTVVNSGKDYRAFFKEKVADGTINKENFDSFKNAYRMAQKFGLSTKVPQSYWNELESILNNNTSIPANRPTNGFKGF